MGGIEIAHPGQRGTSLAAEFHDALALVANDTNDVTTFKGLALRLLDMPSSGASAIWDEVAKQGTADWYELGSDQERWESRISTLARDAAKSRLELKQEAGLALATALELWQQEIRAFQASENLLKDFTASCFFAVAPPPPRGSFHGEIHFEEPQPGVLALQPGSRIVRVIVGPAFQFAGWVTGLAARFRSPDAAAKDIMKRLRQQREGRSRPLLCLDQQNSLTKSLAGKSGVIISCTAYSRPI